MNGIIKALLSRVNFSLGRNPKVPRYRDIDFRDYIPEPYHAVLILSADFELAWAWRYAVGYQDPIRMAIRRARQARTNIPKIIELCNTYNIPITWATVGHLFLEGCRKNGNVPHAHIARLPYHHNQYWTFTKGDWFDADPCSTWEEAPEYYAPDLIRMIVNAKVNHEIACHTFSHIDCRDAICADSVFRSEVQECINLAEQSGIRLKSFIYPANLVGNLQQLMETGFTSYRSARDNVLGYPERDHNGLWEFPSTAELYYRKGWPIQYHAIRHKTIVDRAIKHNRVAIFWFHPSCDEKVVDVVLPAFFAYVDHLRRQGLLHITTTADYVENVLQLNNSSGDQILR